jgi:hypothetical protein
LNDTIDFSNILDFFLSDCNTHCAASYCRVYQVP